MKKVLSVLMAGALTASMAVTAFAASDVTATVYNEDGESIVGNDKDVWGHANVSLTTTDSNSINVDGVVPGITMYIPLGKEMSDKITDGAAAATPTNAQIVAKLKVGSGLDFEKTSKLEKGAKYLNDTLNGAVSATEGSVSAKLIAEKLVSNGDAEEIEQNDTSITATTDKLLNDAGDASIDAIKDDAEASAYHNGTKIVRITSGTPADAIDKATKDVENDLRKVTNAYNDGNYYMTSLSDTAIKTAVDNAKKAATTTPTAKYDISWNSLTDKDLFKFDVDKNDGSKYVSKIELVYDKKLSNLNQRTAFLKVILNDNQTTSDLKSTGTITFKAKKTSAEAKVTTETWPNDKIVKIDYTFWINNAKRHNDDNIGTGDRVFFDPDSNEDNTLVWGDDRAALFFEGNDDASKFYARLQTKSDSEIYSTYGDPVNADLWFYDFVGNPTVPSTSRATLTLGIPWDEDDDYTPNPEDCFIYEKDADGNLIDVTSKFTYNEDNDGTTEISGWTIKTRTLGTYIISDTELDTTVAEEVTEEPTETTDETAAPAEKAIPNTGSSDMVGAAVVAAIVSLAAAGAVVCKKSSK